MSWDCGGGPIVGLQLVVIRLRGPQSRKRVNGPPRKPERSGLVVIGTVIEPMPVTGLDANFPPMPRTAPLPIGKFIVGGETALAAWLPRLSFV